MEIIKHEVSIRNQKAQFNLPTDDYKQLLEDNFDYPLILTTGRIRDQWHTMTRTGKVSRLKTHYSSQVLEINSVDAYLNKIKDGDRMRIFDMIEEDDKK